MIQQLRNILEQRKGQRDQLQKQVTETETKIKKLSSELLFTEQAHAIITGVAQLTQEQLQYHISEIVSLALSAVFDDPYKLEVEFVVRRGKTECDIMFERRGERMSPLSASGGGAVDIATFALRVALWSMQRPRTRNVLILDEPFKWLSSGLQVRAGQMIKEISDKLKLQMIIVSHVPEIIETADKVFTVKLRKGISEVTEG